MVGLVEEVTFLGNIPLVRRFTTPKVHYSEGLGLGLGVKGYLHYIIFHVL